MKLQSILFTLLQVQTVFSDESQSWETPDDCALACKSKLRTSQSKLEECLQAHCGGNEPKGETEVELSGNHSSCVSRCNRLRFGRRKQLQCINKCDREYSYSSGGRSSSVRPSDNFEDAEQCEARCKRLRFSHERQLACIQDCHSEQDDGMGVYNDEDRSKEDERSTSNKSGIDAEESEENSADFLGNTNACVSRCKRLRFSMRKQEECIAGCKEEGGTASSKRSNFDVDEEENSDNSSRSNNACVSRCKRLRFSPARQEKCIDECDQDGGIGKRSDFDANDSEQNDGNSPDNRNPCVVRCKRLRFSSERQADCINNCHPDESYATSS